MNNYSDKNTTTTKVSETRQERKKRMKHEKKEARKKNHVNGLSPFWRKYPIFCDGFPKLATGLCIIVLVLYFVFGDVPPGALTALLGLDYLSTDK